MIKMATTFILVIFSFIFFRAEDLTDAFLIVKSVFSATLFQPAEVSPGVLFILIGIMLCLEWLQRGKKHALEIDADRLPQPLRWAVIMDSDSWSISLPARSKISSTSNSDAMRRFLINTLCFAATLTCGFYVVNLATDAGLRVSRFEEFAEWNDIVDGAINAEVLVNGSSRAWVHISPATLETRLGMSGYNIGLNGYRLNMQLARYELAETQQTPKRDYSHRRHRLSAKAGRSYHYHQFLPYLDEEVLRGAVRQ